MKLRISFLSFFLFILACAEASVPFIIRGGSGETITVSLPEQYRSVLSTAVEILGRDMSSVFGDSISIVDSDARISIRIVPDEVGQKQAFIMRVTDSGDLDIIGHDSHGAAYGVMELSRLIGVSPWEWWADASPEPKSEFRLPERFSIHRKPTVEYRGIFINDEDWGLMPWSSTNYEKTDIPGQIGPATNSRIFELLLRLRANYYWPAMHECTRPFFLTEGNREVAEKYGIYIGGSHCEPMSSSTAVEWTERGRGEYDYVNNRDNVLQFWEERVKEVADQEIIYTLGMRGVHDGAMNGASSLDEQKQVLQTAIADQRALISQYVSPNVESVPQVFIPYKEVLDIYNAGLEVPDDVTLMWCDDNYGYIRHFPTDAEASRPGGNGMYYHVSYWGRPHDYLWLGTLNPALLYQQMKLAYDKGIRKMWILNVGDIKPAEYPIELFLDMAWDIDEVSRKGVSGHLNEFLCREFGNTIGPRILPVMNEHYRLAHIRRPEFMGNTREEEWNDPSYRIVKDLPWSESSIKSRLSHYDKISREAEEIFTLIPPGRKDTYFQLVKYPVQASAQMNKKMLYAQMARHGAMPWEHSDNAFDSIMNLTQTYNQGINNRGKWNGIMDPRPRRLPVFDRVPHVELSEPLVVEKSPLAKWNATEGQGHFILCENLGYECQAASLVPGEHVKFTFDAPQCDSMWIDIRLLPTHPVTNERLSVRIDVDGQCSSEITYHTQGRSEEWKENVLRNQAVKTVKMPLANAGPHTVSVTALDEGVVLDQLIVYGGADLP